MQGKFLARFVLALGVFVSALTLSGCVVFHSRFDSEFHPPALPTPTNADQERKQALDLYHEAWQVVFNDYVDPNFNGQNWYKWKDRYDKTIQTRADAYIAIRTMLASLNDVYTRFLDPRKADDQNMNIDSRLSGLGIQIASKNNKIVVMDSLDGSPAKKGGVLPLDQIVAINGVSTRDMALEDVVDKIRGPKGTPVSLTLLRKGQQVNKTLIRDEIVIKTVFGSEVSPDIGYIRLSSFISQDAPAEMQAKLKQQHNTKAMILDIRGNNGGLLPNALSISEMFLGGKALIVSMVDRSGSRRTFYVDHPPIYTKPLVVLIDQGSASASEILSGALEDNHRAILMGERTFGKGLVQKINYLQDGSELNLTISKYFTPAGHDINKKGIEPNIEVPITLANMQHAQDPQKAAAIAYLKRQIHS